jgi:hypothetical protein
LFLFQERNQHDIQRQREGLVNSRKGDSPHLLHACLHKHSYA